MVDDLVDAVVHVQLAVSAVSGQDELRPVFPDFLQTVQVDAQNIPPFTAAGDVGGDIEQHMVAAEENTVILIVKTHVAHGVARGVDAFKPVPAVAQNFAVLHQPGGHKVCGHVAHGGVVVKGADDAVRHALVAEAVGHSGPDAAVKFHQLNAAQDDGIAHVIQGAQIAGMIGVKMGDEHIGVLGAQIQTLHALQQHFQAVRAVEAGVNQKAPYAVRGLDHIAVDVLQGVVGQLDGKGVDVVRNINGHVLPLFRIIILTIIPQLSKSSTRILPDFLAKTGKRQIVVAFYVPVA